MTRTVAGEGLGRRRLTNQAGIMNVMRRRMGAFDVTAVLEIYEELSFVL